jgi:hypothetical protein
VNFAAHIKRTDRAVQKFLGRDDIEYRPEVGDPITGLRGLFDANHEIQDPITSEVEQVGPVLWIRLEDIAPHEPHTTDNPTIVIDAVEYRVRTRKPDSPVGGSVRLLLQSDF